MARRGRHPEPGPRARVSGALPRALRAVVSPVPAAMLDCAAAAGAAKGWEEEEEEQEEELGV